MKHFNGSHSWIAIFLLFILPSFSFCSAEDAKTLKRDLYNAVSKNETILAQSAVDKLVGIGDLSAAKVIFDLASIRNAQKISYDIFQVLLKGLAALDTNECIDFYLGSFSKSNLFARVVAVDISAMMTSEYSIKLIIKGLKDKNNSVLQSALKATLKRRPKAAVPVLIKLFDEWSNRKIKAAVFYDIKTTLIDLTHENLKLPREWEKWWEAHQNSFDPKKLEKDTRTARKPELGGKDDPKFFGVPISSKNAVFVIDISKSMGLVQKDDIPGLTRVRGVDQTHVVERAKEKLTPENKRLAKYWTRIWMAKRHLIKVLLGLQRPTKFNVIAFHSTPLPMSKRSIMVSTSAKRKAALWVKGLRTRGNTATLDALKTAFQSDRNVNTIYFLSDGVPSKDGSTRDDTDQILKEVLQLNRFRKIKIHTFGFFPFTMAGMPNPNLEQAEKFLKLLAKKTGGTYTAMKVDPNEKPPATFH